MLGLFRRAQRIVVKNSVGSFSCRGVIEKLESGENADVAEADKFGMLSKPLFRYFGDAERVPERGAELLCGCEKYTVLRANVVGGALGAVYTEALLERRTTGNDGD